MLKYKAVIEKSVKKEMNLLGAPVALRQARKVEGLSVDDEGNITSLDDEGLEVFKKLLDSYEEAAGPVVDALISKELKSEFGEELQDIELPERIESKI